MLCTGRDRHSQQSVGKMGFNRMGLKIGHWKREHTPDLAVGQFCQDMCLLSFPSFLCQVHCRLDQDPLVPKLLECLSKGTAEAQHSARRSDR